MYNFTKTYPFFPRISPIVHADYTKTSAPRRLNDLSNPLKANDVLKPKLIAQNIGNHYLILLL